MDLTPQQAFDELQNNPDSVLIDIRSSMEYLFVGHPVGAIHLPWIDEPDWDINPHFAEDLEKNLRGKKGWDVREHCLIILICRSGKRSLQAGLHLKEAGYQLVSHINEGFEGELDENHQRSKVGGWRFRGLPWEQC